MTPEEHKAVAERLLIESSRFDNFNGQRVALATAQVHVLLALLDTLTPQETSLTVGTRVPSAGGYAVCLSAYDGLLCPQPKKHAGPHRAFLSERNAATRVVLWNDDDADSEVTS